MNVIHRVKGEEPVKLRDPEEAQDDLSQRMAGFLARLEGEADKRVKLRQDIDDRMIRDLLQYHGRYDETTEKRLDKKKSSKVFKNRTRPKTNAMIARLFDLLHPTDDRNWSIEPTPVPEMQEMEEDTAALVEDSEDTFEDYDRRLKEAEAKGPDGEEEAAAIAAEMEELAAIQAASKKAADELAEKQAEAARRCRLMQTEIDDQLKECRFQATTRKVITDACKLGIGIAKSPVLGGTQKRRWTRLADGTHALTVVEGETPAAIWVDPWSFYPSMDVKEPEDSEGFFERHLVSKSRLRKMARFQENDADAIRTLLKEGSTSDLPSYLTDLRDVTKQNKAKDRDLYTVWEYTGPIDKEDMMLLAEATDDDELMMEMEDADELLEEHVRVTFCQGRLISFGLHPLESQDALYSVFNLEEDETSMFGFGIPYLMRDSQSIMNSAQRMVMDNAGLSVGPQVVVNKRAVTPEDGDHQLSPMKVWNWNSDEDQRTPPFAVFDIPSNQQFLAAIMDITDADIDEETSLPQIAQGEQGTGVTKTAQGMALLMNSANVLFKRFVKNFDDNYTVPTIQKFYHWNMQFSEKEQIKGDYEVVARGSSVLLVREMQANNLMMMLQMFGDHPILGPWLKPDEMLKQLFRAHMLNSAEILKTEREWRKDQKEAQAQEDPAAAIEGKRLEIEQKKLELMQHEIDLKAETSNAEWAARQEIARLEYARAMQIDVERLNVELEKVEAMKGDKERAERIKQEGADRRLAAEIAMKQRTGDSAGGSV